MRRLAVFTALIVVVFSYTSRPASGVLVHDADVTPDVIFGSGNGNGFFARDQTGSLELGLRAKVPFLGTYNSDGAGTYTFASGTPWNIEWTVNTDWDGIGGDHLDALNYSLKIDIDPSATVNFAITFDPVAVLGGVPDNSIGDNTTANGGGVETADLSTYLALLSSMNVAQNSLPISDGTAAVGEYTFELEALSGPTSIASTSIVVSVVAVPEPTAFLFGSLIAGVMGLTVSRRRA